MVFDKMMYSSLSGMSLEGTKLESGLLQGF
jgi:hypothetical protein